MKKLYTILNSERFNQTFWLVVLVLALCYSPFYKSSASTTPPQYGYHLLRLKCSQCYPYKGKDFKNCIRRNPRYTPECDVPNVAANTD